MTDDELFKADADYGNIVRELVLVETRLRVAREIAEDFRGNTSLDTIIRDYGSRIKELKKALDK